METASEALQAVQDQAMVLVSDVPVQVACEHLKELASDVSQSISLSPGGSLASSLICLDLLLPRGAGCSAQPVQSLSQERAALVLLCFVPWLW